MKTTGDNNYQHGNFVIPNIVYDVCVLLDRAEKDDMVQEEADHIMWELLTAPWIKDDFKKALIRAAKRLTSKIG